MTFYHGKKNHAWYGSVCPGWGLWVIVKCFGGGDLSESKGKVTPPVWYNTQTKAWNMYILCVPMCLFPSGFNFLSLT